MSTWKELELGNRRVVVIGLGVSGVETARWFRLRGVPVTVLERQVESEFRTKSKFKAEADQLIAAGAEIRFGCDGEGVVPHLRDAAFVVLSPGVPLTSPTVNAVERLKIPYSSELELGIEQHGRTVLAVTGSNGKSTSVTLLQEFFVQGGKDSILCGNVGVPVIASAPPEPQRTEGFLVVEASSYQLESCRSIHPRAAIFLNLSENHLERHGTMQRYADAKARLFDRMGQADLAVFAADDAVVRKIGAAHPGRKAFFGEDEQRLRELGRSYAVVRYESAEDRSVTLHSGAGPERYDLTRMKLLGRHNCANAAATLLVARDIGISADDCRAVLAKFEPLEHRIEPVSVPGSRIVINDSKSTTVAASVAALSTVYESYPDRHITLLVGGLSKAGSWDPLLKAIETTKERMSSVLCFGKDGPLIASHLTAAGLTNRIVGQLRDAVEISRTSTPERGLVLLSPGCASFDEFTDFEDRGRAFKRFAFEVFGG